MPPANAVSLLREGATVAGKYRIERVLGLGGMGMVLAARHLVLDERVALKFLHPEAQFNAEAIARFMREARAASRIKSEHVARVADVGQLEDGSPFIVMEYLEGIDLFTWITDRGPMAVEQAVDFVLQACEALAEAHTRGIIHRDLKPSNLFCVTKPDGASSIKVLDFGISKVITPGALDHKLTKADSMLGSPVYMSPEQMTRSRDVDAGADVWSLGVILFELVTGRPPFDAETVAELAIKVATEPPRPLRATLARAPAGLEEAIARCLEKDRTKRFRSVGEVAIALQDFGTSAARLSAQTIQRTLARTDRSTPSLDGGARSSEARLVHTLQVSATDHTQLSWGGPYRSLTRRTAIAAALTGVGVVAAVVLIVLARRPSPRELASGGAARGVVAVSVEASSPAPVESPRPTPPSTAVATSVAPTVRPHPSSLPSPRPARAVTSVPAKPDDDRLGI